MIATARLEHFAVATFAADRAVVAALLPEGVEVDLPLVSAVAYRYVGLGLRGLPAPRLSAAQVHLRAYVRVGDEQGVWFLRTVQDSRWATLPHHLWGMPWERGHVDIGEPSAGRVTVAAEGIELDIGPMPDATAPPEVPDEVSAATVGWFQGRQAVKRFEVAYGDSQVRAARAGTARVEPFEALGLVRPTQMPQSSFLRPSTTIEIHLPPTEVMLVHR